MKKNVVFSIVARNYLSLAYALGDSLKKYNEDYEYHIIIADRFDGLDKNQEPFSVLSLEDIGLDGQLLDELAFKYGITEFCTAVKPFCFDYFFKNGFSKAIYFDPDICTFSSLNPIFNELEKKSIVVTPHFFTVEEEYTGTITEQLLLHVGGFNFGFVGVSTAGGGQAFINWWKNRLTNFSYQDKIEALHTDQKFGDLIPSFFFDDLFVSKDLGRNMSFWNLHERNLILKDDSYFVENKITNQQTNQLIFYHFAGYEITRKGDLIHKNHREYKFSDFPEIDQLYKWYGEQLQKWNFKKYISIDYGYSKFDNGIMIKHYHRRLYRRLLMDNVKIEKPFSILYEQNNFYNLLTNNNLIPKSNKNVDKVNEVTLDSFDSKVNIINKFMILFKSIVGSDRYFLLMKFFQRYSKVENQHFLLKEYRKDYKFFNENRKGDLSIK